MTKQTTQTENWEQAEVKSNFVKFNKVGDFIQGTIVEIVTPAKPDLYGKLERKFVIKASGGEYHDTTGGKTVVEVGEKYKVAEKKGIDAQTKDAVIGNVVLFKYTESKPAKTPGHQNIKVIIVWFYKDAEKRRVVEKVGDNTEAQYEAEVAEAVDNF